MERIKRWEERIPDNWYTSGKTQETVFIEYLNDLADHIEQLENLQFNKDHNEGITS